MDIDVGRARETDFVHLRDEMGEQELMYLERTQRVRLGGIGCAP